MVTCLSPGVVFEITGGGGAVPGVAESPLPPQADKKQDIIQIKRSPQFFFIFPPLQSE
jgi:hypothetical protein